MHRHAGTQPLARAPRSRGVGEWAIRTSVRRKDPRIIRPVSRDGPDAHGRCMSTCPHSNRRMDAAFAHPFLTHAKNAGSRRYSRDWRRHASCLCTKVPVHQDRQEVSQRMWHRPAAASAESSEQHVSRMRQRTWHRSPGSQSPARNTGGTNANQSVKTGPNLTTTTPRMRAGLPLFGDGRDGPGTTADIRGPSLRRACKSHVASDLGGDATLVL